MKVEGLSAMEAFNQNDQSNIVLRTKELSAKVPPAPQEKSQEQHSGTCRGRSEGRATGQSLTLQLQLTEFCDFRIAMCWCLQTRVLRRAVSPGRSGRKASGVRKAESGGGGR